MSKVKQTANLLSKVKSYSYICQWKTSNELEVLDLVLQPANQGPKACVSYEIFFLPLPALSDVFSLSPENIHI